LNLGPGFKNPTDEEQYLNLSTNYLFKGTSYTFNLDDFYDDTNLYKVYTGAKFQTEAFNGTSLEWTGVVNNDTVTPVNNTETQFGDPSNISMVGGTTDSVDNMKANDASYTTFTSTHTDGYIREMPSQWSDFTFTKGTGGIIGELETIDADYSVIDSSNAVGYNEFIDSITLQAGTLGPGTLANTHTDDSNYLQINSEYVAMPFYNDVVAFSFNFDPALAGRDLYISADIVTNGVKPGELRVNGVNWKTGGTIDFDNQLHTGVNSISFFVGPQTPFNLQIYYFKIVEGLTPVPAEADVQVDMQITDPDITSIEYLKYSHKTDVSATIDLDIWNWIASTWYEIESVDNFATFDDDSFTLGSSSNYVSGTNQVRIRFQGSESSNFDLQIDRLRLDYLTIPPAELEMTITFSFSNYNEDLLAMNVQNWQRTNISQTITYKIWNYNTEDYVQISSSSDTSFTKKEYNTTSPADFISPTGTVKLYWVGTDLFDDFELHIDYLLVQIYYKLDLIHLKSFDTNGIFRYRWAVLGSIQYTQWVTFEVVDPEPNLHAISESDNPTRWLLQGAALSPFENFTDDIAPSSAWGLYDTSPTDFNVYIPELENYLTDYITFYGSSYESPAQWGDFDFTKGAGNTVGELETNDADEAIVDSGITYSGESLLGTIKPYNSDLLTQWNEGSGTPHWSKLDEGVAGAPDGGAIKESHLSKYDSWNFDSLVIPAGRIVTRMKMFGYVKNEGGSDTYTVVTSSVAGGGIWPGWVAGGWNDFSNSGLTINQAELNSFWIKVRISYTVFPGWVELEAVYVEVYTSLMSYSVDYTITWDIGDPESFENLRYDYRTTFAVDSDLDIYNWDTTVWLELQSNTDVNWHTSSYTLTDPYISVSDEIKIRFQSALTTTNFDMELDMIVLEYNSIYTISKKHNNTIPGYAYMQTNTIELVSLSSSVYGTNYTLSSGDYFEVDFQTSSDSQINLILFKDGVVNAILILSQSGNPNFNRHTVQIPVDEYVEFDQLKIISTFEDTDYVRIHDIKTYKYTITGDHADFIVGSHQDYELYLTPDTYNLRINDPYDAAIKIDTNITISSGYNYYLYEPTEIIQCRLTLFSIEGDYLQFEDYHIKINRSLNGGYNQLDLVDPLFYVDEETYIYIEVYDRFDASINNFSRLTSSYIDLEIEVYSLQIKNLQTQKTTVDINTTHIYPLLSEESLYFMLAKDYYQIGYYDTNSVYKQFMIYLDSNQAYELNRSKIVFLAYVNQKGEHLYFDDYKTYINGSLIYENIFYREIGDKIGIEVKEIYGISIKNQSYTVVSDDNYIPVVLTMYSLKVMNQQGVFNHINITRDPNYYESSYYWSEWIAPNEIIKFRLFPGYYKIRLTDNEGSSFSFYSYTLNGDDVLLISSGNTLAQVIYNIANVNTTIGNQITNVEINITNQNSNINNTIVNIQINLSNINSTLGTLLTNIETSISNINSSIVSEIISLGVSITNINTSISNQILTISADLTNINTTIVNQILSLGVDITNINTTIVNQITAIGVNITNMNSTIVNQILTVIADLTNINTTIVNQITAIGVNITNMNST
ncbi:hypothetical protein LCGC14_1325600, partial [marine sediment metagenome]